MFSHTFTVSVDLMLVCVAIGGIILGLIAGVILALGAPRLRNASKVLVTDIKHADPLGSAARQSRKAAQRLQSTRGNTPA